MKSVDWDGLFKRGRDYSSTTTSELTRLLDMIGPIYGRAIDLGCGTGQLSRELYHRNFEVVGIDGSKSATKIAKVASPYVKYLQVDLEKPFPSEILENKYDLATCKLVFAFIHKKQDFINRVRELMNKNGTFAIITPTLEQVVSEKRHIAVDLGETLSLLKSSFNNVAHYKSNGLTVFVARD